MTPAGTPEPAALAAERARYARRTRGRGYPGARAARAETAARADPPPVTSFVEVNVFPGRIEVYERCGHGLPERLKERLRSLGVEVTATFEAPCG